MKGADRDPRGRYTRVLGKDLGTKFPSENSTTQPTQHDQNPTHTFPSVRQIALTACKNLQHPY